MFTGTAFLIDPTNVADRPWRLVLTAVLAVMLFCLGMAGYLANRATAKPLDYCVPTPDDVLRRASMTEADASADRALQLLRHYNCNFYFSHFKIVQVRFAGLWFRAALGCFAALSILLAVYAAVEPIMAVGVYEGH